MNYCARCHVDNWGDSDRCKVCGGAFPQNKIITQSEQIEALEKRVEDIEKRLSLLDWKA